MAKATKTATKSGDEAGDRKATTKEKKPRSRKYVYDFEQGNRNMKDLLGGKGANLGEMTNLGLPVPPGFTITHRGLQRVPPPGADCPRAWWDEVARHMKTLEKKMGRRFGDAKKPPARLGALGGQVLDARHDGQPSSTSGSTTPRSPAWRSSTATSASPPTPIAVSSRCSARS